MMNVRNEMQDSKDEATIAALLRAAGPRPMPSAEAMAAARAAVEAEWRDAITARGRTRRPIGSYAGWAVAASVVVATVAVWMVRSNVESPAARVASLARVEGEVEQDRGDGQWAPLETTDAVREGSRLRTSTGGRAALVLANGVELRLDTATLIAFRDVGHASLAEGAVYVDSGANPGPAARDLVLDTPAGNVRHLGTQYFARVSGDSLKVGVREGRVALAGPAGTAIGAPGEQLTIAEGKLSRAPLARTAEDWQWIADVTPPFDLEGRAVEEFLIWAARETGRTIVYATPEAGQQARTVTLSGSVEGLTPDAAIEAVLSTTSLKPEIGTDRIRVEASTH